MNEIEYERMQEDAAIGQAIANNLQIILDGWDVENVAQLYRAMNKYIGCGPWLSVKLHDGTWRHSDQLQGVENGNVRALLVGSIVEGSDAEVVASPIDLMDYMNEGDEQRLTDDFNQTLDWVDGEADRLWAEDNAEVCPACGSEEFTPQFALVTGIETNYKSCDACAHHWGHE